MYSFQLFLLIEKSVKLQGLCQQFSLKEALLYPTSFYYVTFRTRATLLLYIGHNSPWFALNNVCISFSGMTLRWYTSSCLHTGPVSAVFGLYYSHILFCGLLYLICIICNEMRHLGDSKHAWPSMLMKRHVIVIIIKYIECNNSSLCYFIMNGLHSIYRLQHTFNNYI
jgi:hypothetical protein